jgi:hypothetical protein
MSTNYLDNPEIKSKIKLLINQIRIVLSENVRLHKINPY